MNAQKDGNVEYLLSPFSNLPIPEKLDKKSNYSTLRWRGSGYLLF